MRRLRSIALLTGLVGSLSGASVAQESPSTNAGQSGDVIGRLMGEPLTLFDWGLAQLDRDMARVASRLFPSAGAGQRPRHGSIYDWRRRRVTMYLSHAALRNSRTQDTCRNLFQRSVAELTAGAPVGPDAAGWYLLNAFKPKGHAWGGRFEDIGAQLADKVTLEILLLPQAFEAAAGDTRRVKCSGPLSAGPEDIVYDMSS